MEKRSTWRVRWALWTAVALYLVLSLRWEVLLPRRFGLVAAAVCLFLATPVSDWRRPVRVRVPGARQAVDVLASLLAAAAAVAALVAAGDATLDRVTHDPLVNLLAVLAVAAFGLRRILWGEEGEPRRGAEGGPALPRTHPGKPAAGKREP